MLTERTWRGRVFIKPEFEHELEIVKDTGTLRKMKAGIHKGWWYK